jgi:DNA-binding beta-propeller fold protein YncE
MSPPDSKPVPDGGMSVQRILVAAVLAAAPMASAAGGTQPAGRSGYEVWVLDQSDTRGLDHGGTVYIFAGADFGRAGATPTPAATIDLGGETAALCRQKTGANPVRPHMVLFNRDDTHASLAFVASGHVVLFDAAARKPLDCVRTTQAPTGRQAHAAFPSPDGTYILVANQNGKRLERIDADFAKNTFTHNEAATLDLATCKTPSGAPCQAPDLRPDNAPICPVLSESGDLAFVTLRGGGLFVVDPRPAPMRIVAEYDMATVKGNGCGGAQVGGQMYVNSGGRPGKMDHLQLYGFDVYRFSLDQFRAAKDLAPNTPSPKVVFKTDGEHDSHGMVLTGGGKYVWVMDRHADVVEVLGTADDAHVRTIALNGELTSNAAPDLTDAAPDGDLVFVALRGPTPLSGDPHNATGATPGVGVLEVTDGGRNGRLRAIVRLSNVGADGVERADPHGLRVRRLR